MRALLINPFEEKISEIDYDGDWQSIAKLIQIGSRPFTLVQCGDTDSHHIYLDDEGLFQPAQRFFLLRGYPSPLAGKGLVLRDNGQGDEAGATVTVASLSRNIQWLPASIRFTGTTTREGETDHPLLGRMTFIESTPHFIDTKRMNKMAIYKSLRDARDKFLTECEALLSEDQSMIEEMEAEPDLIDNDQQEKIDQLKSEIELLEEAIEAAEAIE